MDSYESFVVPRSQLVAYMANQWLTLQRNRSHPYATTNRIVGASRLRQLPNTFLRLGATTYPSYVHNTGFDFNQEISVSNLNTFISHHLQPTTQYNTEMNHTVNEICSFLRGFLAPNEIVKGGSLGKGTAVKGMSDIDLVVVLSSNYVRDAGDLKQKLPGMKRHIKRILSVNSGRFGVIDTSISETPFSVQFTVKASHEDIKVDMLLTFPFTDLNSLYLRMRNDVSHSQYYNAAVVKGQIQFVKERPANLKNLIRLVKYWKKSKVKGNGYVRMPTSYVMELITIHLWEENTRRSGDINFNTLKAFHGVMKALANYRSLSVIWLYNYDLVMVPLEKRIQRPLMMDPANPMNNVCERFSWDEIASAAIRQLRSPMLRGINSDSWQ